MEIRYGFDQSFSIEDAERLGTRRLAELVVVEAYRDVGMLQALRLALASHQTDGFLVQILADEIEAIRTDRRFHDYREAHLLATQMDRIREGITRDLLPRSPRSAACLLGQLIRLDGHAFEHSDEAGDSIAEVIKRAVTDYGRAWAAVPDRDINALAAHVLAVFSGNEYGVHDEIIVAFRHALASSWQPTTDTGWPTQCSRRLPHARCWLSQRARSKREAAAARCPCCRTDGSTFRQFAPENRGSGQPSISPVAPVGSMQ
jgi:hypothetical protein